MEVRQGSINRRKRSFNLALKMWADYTDKDNPLTIEEIAQKYVKRNGRHYNKNYIYEIFKKFGFK